MKTAILSAILIVIFASCGPSKRLPAAPDPGGYAIDSLSLVGLHQHTRYEREAKRHARMVLTKKTVTAIGMAAFGTYCILAWRFDIE